MDMSHLNDKSRSVLLVGYDRTDHYAGLRSALERRGVRAVCDEPCFDDSTAVVVVMDTTSTRAQWALKLAGEYGVPAVLLMDGIIEYRNTYLNPNLEPGFLESVPVDVIACAGENDRSRLESLGNRAVATGLPRLEGLERLGAGGGGVLVATAKTPAFGDEEYALLVAAFGRVRSELEVLGVPVLWRLTGGLEYRVRIVNDDRPLRECLAACRAVITTPSTVLVESMLAGRPTALLDPFNAPCWQESAWTLGADVDAEILRSLLSPSVELLDEQERVLAGLHAPDPSGALARLCVELMQSKRGTARRHAAHSPGPERLAIEPSDDLLIDAIRAAVSGGARRIAIYGTGRHTRRAESLRAAGLPIVGFIDDAAHEGARLWGLPVVPLDRCADKLRPDVVVLSSDQFEQQMMANCERVLGGVVIVPLYSAVAQADTGRA